MSFELNHERSRLESPQRKDSLYSGTELEKRYLSLRELSERICEPLETEDYVVQGSDESASPKWRLGHTTWFFEKTFLEKHSPGYRSYNSIYSHIFGTSFMTFEKKLARDRKNLSRPTVKEVLQYRSMVDEKVLILLSTILKRPIDEQQAVLDSFELAFNHEQRNQELLLTDIKSIFANNPMSPTYSHQPSTITYSSAPLSPEDFRFNSGVYMFGADHRCFAFENEKPVHSYFLNPFRLRYKLVTNGEFLEFINDGGYEDPRLWLEDGWRMKKNLSWQAPGYWQEPGNWYLQTLHGPQPLTKDAPVCHISFYEADAYARWCRARLPTEYEWELACKVLSENEKLKGHFFESGNFQPTYSPHSQIWGGVWEWTQSPYGAYPGQTPNDGVLSEYNGKFMNNRRVLRGGSVITQASHVRSTYRNFLTPECRLQFSGMRLAFDENC
ncbi:MAG: ergothioneine biosynthesis protein EgtB [Pseudobdellovibrionaceae bacterium]